jgi:hypothetical protein
MVTFTTNTGTKLGVNPAHVIFVDPRPNDTCELYFGVLDGDQAFSRVVKGTLEQVLNVLTIKSFGDGPE